MRMYETTADAERSEAEERLFRVEQYTDADGTSEIAVDDWSYDEQSEEITLEFQTPTGTMFDRTYDLPEVNDPESFEFVHIVNVCGYSLSQAIEIRYDDETTVPARYDSDAEAWELDLPPAVEPTWRNRLRAFGQTLASMSLSDNYPTDDEDEFSFWVFWLVSPIIMGVGFCLFPLDGDAFGDEARGYITAVWHITLWIFVFAIVVLLL